VTRLGDFSPIWANFIFGQFFSEKFRSSPNFRQLATFFDGIIYVNVNVGKIKLGDFLCDFLCDFFTNSSGHPAYILHTQDELNILQFSLQGSML
jgi:hypothetical protein